MIFITHGILSCKLESVHNRRAVDNGIVIAASYWGKFKTVSQMILIILMIMDIQNTIFQTLITVFIVIAVALTIISLVDYIAKNRKVLSMQD